MKKLKPFNKYYYYFESVQDTEQAIHFIERAYREHFRKPLITLSEDFCGTFALCCEWVKKGKGRKAIGVDLSKEPLEYGKANYLSQLSPKLQSNVSLFNKNVTDKTLPPVDTIVAFNYSFNILKERSQLLAYFKNCHRRLSPKGLFILDCFGGSGTLKASVESNRNKGFRYYWDQKGFDPITHHAKFAIHIKRDGEKKRKNVFTYDWRMWTLPELKDLLLEAGFKDICFYFEGGNKDGSGNGIFTKKTKEEDCEAWIAYVTASRK